MDTLGLPTVWIPHSYGGCNQHAPDEHMLIPVARQAAYLIAKAVYVVAPNFQFHWPADAITQGNSLVHDADGSLVADQFTGDISGIAGTQTIAGFDADSLLVRTMEGDPLVDTDPNHLNFVSAPVFVHDIELMDPVTLDTFTFDGILGTNYLFGSGDLSALSGFPVPFREGPFEWLVLDLDASTPSLGMIFPVSVPALPPVFHLIAAALLGAVGTRFLRVRRR